MKHNNRYLIKTPTGYNEFSGLKEIIEHGLIIITDKEVIKCTKTHRIQTTSGFKQAQMLTSGDRIGNQTVQSVLQDKQRKYYDPINVSGDVYVAQGLIHHNCSILVCDEAAFVKSTKWEEFTDSIFPSQSGLAWKKNIILSTANGMNHFERLVAGAREKSNGYNISEVKWTEVPRYNSDGTKMTNDEFQKKIVDKHGIVHFNQNYANEFLGSSYTLISSSQLQKMEPHNIEEIRDGKLKIYKYPIKNHKYIMSIDAAKDGTDAFAVQIVDITDFRFEQAASAQLQVDYLLMPEFINEWCEFYNNPYLIIENNEGAGQSCADVMYQTYEYENLHFDKDVGRNKKKRYPGFRTTTKTRKQILQTMKLFIENDKLQINDKNTINEFLQFILIKNKYQADDGAKDDAIMSLGMIFVPFCNTKNFQDMKVLVQNLYNSDDLEDSDKINFGELLTIGSFDDGTDEEYEQLQEQKEYLTIEEAIADNTGFI